MSDAEKDATKFDVDAAVTAPSDGGIPSAYPDTPVPDYTEGQFFPNSPAPGYPLSNEPGTKRKSVIGSFGPGFQFETPDEEFGLQVHLESQIEARVWGQRDQFPGNSGFFMPRQRIFFNGHITKRIEYEFSINRGLGGTVNILNAFLNLHVDDRFEVKFGRFFTPLTYDQYAISNYWMPTPERSLFTTNVGLGRQVGLMGWGYLFDKRLDYAAGIFNGSRNSFESLNNGVDFVAFLNARPFQESEGLDFLRFLNLGSSVAFGYQDQPPVPVSFRIGGGSPNGDVPGAGTTPFLILNPGVIERGDRLLGSVHSAYYYKSLSLIGEWQYGYGSYASFSHPASTAVPFSGFYFVGGYFLTGEEVERRSRVTPQPSLLPDVEGARTRAGCLGSRRSGQRVAPGREYLHLGVRRPLSLVQPGRDDGARPELVFERIPENVHILAAWRFRPAGRVQAGRIPEDSRHVLAEMPALLLTRSPPGPFVPEPSPRRGDTAMAW